MNKELAMVTAGTGITVTAVTTILIFSSIKKSKEEKAKYERGQAEIAAKYAHEQNLAKIKADAELEEKKIMATMPDSYWESEKVKAEEASKQFQMKIEGEVKKNKDRLEAEKNMPAGYFERDAAIRKAEIEADAAIKKAEAEAEATKKKAEEERKAAIEKAEREAEASKYVAQKNSETALEQARMNRLQMDRMMTSASTILNCLK